MAFLKRHSTPWMLKAYRILARLKGLRGTAFDVFGYTQERKQEKELLANYEAVVEEIVAGLNKKNLGSAVALAGYPELIRGYGHVKEANVEKAMAERMKLRAAFNNADGALEALAAE